MKRTLWIAICLMILGCSCTSIEEKHLMQLISKLDVTTSDGASPDVVIIIPGNGCESCIEDALNAISVSNDTAYILICNSAKEFYLLSGGKKASMFNNLYLDKEHIASGSGLVQNYPMVYFFKEGKYESKEAYKPTKKKKAQKKLTIVDVEKKVIDLGNIKMHRHYTDSIQITNIGNEAWVINEIQTSCECVQAKIDRQNVAILESTCLTITFQPEDLGEFERYVYVYGNMQESPLEISIKGCIK